MSPDKFWVAASTRLRHNVGTHVVSLWDAAFKLVATQMATAETPSGKQSVQFSIPVPIAVKQTFTCGYLAPAGHFSYDKSTFAVQKDAPPLHVPIQGGVYAYATQASTWPTNNNAAGANYWVDVLFLRTRSQRNWGASYRDQTVASGTTYYYVLTAVDDQGREGVNSSEVRVIIP